MATLGVPGLVRGRGGLHWQLLARRHWARLHLTMRHLLIRRHLRMRHLLARRRLWLAEARCTLNSSLELLPRRTGYDILRLDPVTGERETVVATGGADKDPRVEQQPGAQVRHRVPQCRR